MIFAIKPIKFDRVYVAGEMIPSDLVTPMAKKRLLEMRVIEESPGFYFEQDPIRVIPTEDVALKPENDPEQPMMDEDIPYSLEALKKMKKEQLKALALDFGVGNVEPLKVDELVMAIYAAETAGL